MPEQNEFAQTAAYLWIPLSSCQQITPIRGLSCDILKFQADVERDHIVRVLEQTNWRVSGKNGAAEMLGLNRSTRRVRMRKLVIRRP